MDININNIDIHYKRSGEGRPLILLHGNGEDHHIFDALGDKLSQHYTVYAVDSRNHGKSAKHPDVGYDAMTLDVYAFITALKLTKVSILGFSDGAIIALQLAMAHPDLLDKIVLLGINLSPSDFKPHVYQEIKDAYAVNQDPLYKLMLEQPQIKLADVASVTTPALLFAGQDDCFKQSVYDDLMSVLPNAQFKLMEGHNHTDYIVNTDIIYPDVIKFLN
ncbi:hypothetical protein CYY_003682 [Polysphondylium violaceum]|uniref:AB hydrolase-1 domain-containing protein n=1 Tax=Polysphondylium violaceum TaxID=133409 RepID=A0A8J4V021_9MYCE|nr:hypothetical protein CYY_003682 [Polysphondylium violaceum]